MMAKHDDGKLNFVYAWVSEGGNSSGRRCLSRPHLAELGGEIGVIWIRLSVIGKQVQSDHACINPAWQRIQLTFFNDSYLVSGRSQCVEDTPGSPTGS